MKVTKSEFDQLIADNDASTLGFCITLKTGDSASTGREVTQCFIVDSDAITEIGRMTGNVISMLSANAFVSEEDASKFRLLWRKIIRA